jgi:hypothetical protein
MDAMSAFSVPASALETAGKQDEVGALKTARSRQRRHPQRMTARVAAVNSTASAGGQHTTGPVHRLLLLGGADRLQVIRLKAALNEKEMELIELREQHMQLVVSAVGDDTSCSKTRICSQLPSAFM